MKQGLKTGTAGLIAYAIYVTFHLPEGYWAVFTALIGAQANLGASWRAALYRTAGSTVGALSAALLTPVIGIGPVRTGVTLFLLAALFAYLTTLHPGFSAAGFTAALVLLLGANVQPWHLAWLRVLYTVLGAVIAFAVGILLWPVCAREGLRSKIADFLEDCGRLYRAVTSAALEETCDEGGLEPLRTTLRDDWPKIATALEESRSEPSFNRFDDEGYVALLAELDHLRQRLLEMCRDSSLSSHAGVLSALVPELEPLAGRTAQALLSLASAVRTRSKGFDLGPLDNAAENVNRRLQHLRDTHATSPVSLDRVLPFWSFLFSLKEVVAGVRSLERKVWAAFVGVSQALLGARPEFLCGVEFLLSQRSAADFVLTYIIDSKSLARLAWATPSWQGSCRTKGGNLHPATRRFADAAVSRRTQSMKAFLIAVITGVLCGGSATAQEPAAQASGSLSQSSAGSVENQGAQVNSQTSEQGTAHATNSTGNAGAQVAQGTTIHAVLAKPLDSRKSKIGDEVVAKSTLDVKSNGQVVVPKGTKLVGHITEAKAKAKGESDSALGIAFDRAVLKDGRELPLALSIQALAATQSTASAAMESDSMMGSPSMSTGGHASGGVVGGATAPVGAVAGTATNTLGGVGAAAGGTVPGATEGMTAGGTLTSSARGVVGLPGMSLNTDASNSTQGSVITSKNQNVHLDSGTQMVLRVNAQ